MSVSSSRGPTWYRYLRFWRRDVQGDIDAELHFHLEARVEELVEHGMSRQAARAQALEEFGDVHNVRTRLREIDDRFARRRDRLEVFDTWRQDAVYAARSLWRTPAVSLTIITTLALGLGVNASMFSLLDVVFLRPPVAVAHPEAVRRVWSEQTFSDGVNFWPGYDYRGYAALSQSLGSRLELATYTQPQKLDLGDGENPPTANVSGANSDYFRVLGLRPLIGRFYNPEEDRLDGPEPVAVVSEAFWRRRLNGSASALGRQINLGVKRYTVIGVTPARFTGVELDATDVWVPLGSIMPGGQTAWYRNPNVNGLQIIGRLPAGASEGELEQRLTAVLRGPNIGWSQESTTVARLGSIVKANGPGKIAAEVQVATRLGGVAVIVLLIACANVVNLLLARAVRRQREIAVRLALGISRGRLVRMLVTESVLLALGAVVAALFAAYWGGAALRNLLMPQVHWAESPMHWRVMGFAVLGAVAAGTVAGLVPALQSRVSGLTNALKAGAREGGVHRSRLRSFLIIAQAALSVMLLVGAGLFVESLSRVRGKDIGYAVDRLAFVHLQNSKLDQAARDAQSDRLLALEPRLARIPGVEAVAYTSMRPTWGMSWLDYFPQADTIAHKKPAGFFTAVTPGFFAATGTRILRGRTFGDGASGASEPFTVIVNEEMARGLWPNEDPLGKCVRFDDAGSPCATVIGVAQTALLNNITEQPEPRFYLSMRHMPIPGGGVGDVVLRVDPSRMSAVTAEVRTLLRAEFPQVFSQTVTMADAMQPNYRPWRVGAIVFSLFGGLALIVAAIGVYSTISYAVGQRTHEFGVRAALGATMSDVLRQVLGEGLTVVGIGVAVGVLLALAAGRLVAALLYGIQPSDPVAIVGASSILLASAILATLVPAWRAAKANPVDALRAD
jgi:predicted permease